MELVQPQVFLVGYTCINHVGLKKYLEASGNLGFIEDIEEALANGYSMGEVLCSFYAKLCYRSLTEGKNPNVKKVSNISDNLQRVFESGHGSVFEHCQLNFVTMDCSRIETHEQVRHRVGVAYSQESGRFCRPGEAGIGFVMAPELEPIKAKLIGLLTYIEHAYGQWEKQLIKADMSMDERKAVTSALRRILPNGMANTIGWSVNLRALRRKIQMRTSRHAEWEIRCVFNQVADIVLLRWPHILYGGRTEKVKGYDEWTGLIV